jgi:phage FluMu protein Com
MQTAPRQCPPTVPQAQKELRCWRCGRLLARLLLLPGCRVEVKCRDCRALNVAGIEASPTTKETSGARE